MKKKLSVLILSVGVFAVASCSTTGSKVVTDSSGDKPSWAKSSKISWEENNKVFIRGTSTVRGNERVDACYDLAKLDAKEALVSEIQSDIKGVLDNSIQSISENAEVVLGKSRTSEFEGKIMGQRFSERYFERAIVSDNERVECQLLSEISQKDYDRMKRLIVDKVQEVDPKIKEAIKQKHIDFFAAPKKDETTATTN